MGKEIIKKNGGVPARIGHKFSEKLEFIKDERLANRKSKERVSTEKLTNLIIKHPSWEDIEKDIINATSEEIEKHGL